jgi:hypothetical protein
MEDNMTTESLEKVLDKLVIDKGPFLDKLKNDIEYIGN